MLEWTYRNYSFDADLQIIHADVRIVVDGEEWVNEPLCIDVGLPALMLSLTEDTTPNKLADPVEHWRSMPFVVCGCGDPECRGFSIAVSHASDDSIRLALLQEREGRPPRTLAEAEVAAEQYKDQVLRIAEDYLKFIDDLEYRPLLADAAMLVRELAEECKNSDT